MRFCVSLKGYIVRLMFRKKVIRKETPVTGQCTLPGSLAPFEMIKQQRTRENCEAVGIVSWNLMHG
jgi:hypothetical protein